MYWKCSGRIKRMINWYKECEYSIVEWMEKYWREKRIDITKQRNWIYYQPSLNQSREKFWRIIELKRLKKRIVLYEWPSWEDPPR